MFTEACGHWHVRFRTFYRLASPARWPLGRGQRGLELGWVPATSGAPRPPSPADACVLPLIRWLSVLVLCCHDRGDRLCRPPSPQPSLRPGLFLEPPPPPRRLSRLRSAATASASLSASLLSDLSFSRVFTALILVALPLPQMPGDPRPSRGPLLAHRALSSRF